MSDWKNSSPTEVQASRERIQTDLGLGITVAQDWCAGLVHTRSILLSVYGNNGRPEKGECTQRSGSYSRSLPLGLLGSW